MMIAASALVQARSEKVLKPPGSVNGPSTAGLNSANQVVQKDRENRLRALPLTQCASDQKLSPAIDEAEGPP